jgi:hypothetical protein
MGMPSSVRGSRRRNALAASPTRFTARTPTAILMPAVPAMNSAMVAWAAPEGRGDRRRLAGVPMNGTANVGVAATNEGSAGRRPLAHG